MVEFTVKCPVIVCTQTAHGNMSRGKKCVKETSLIGPLESDIVKVRDMSEKDPENKVYCTRSRNRARIIESNQQYTTPGYDIHVIPRGLCTDQY